MDNEHHITGSVWDESMVNLFFDLGELLFVWNPTAFTIEEKRFQIDDASKVRWQWYSYGRPATSENLHYFEFSKRGNEIASSTNWPHWTPQRPDPNLPAVEIL